MMKSKPKFLSLVVFLLSHQTSPTLANNINVPEVESFVVERRFGNYDLFTVNMKPGYTCTTGNEQVYQWCEKLQAGHVGSYLCKCQCKNGFGSFVSPLEKCVNAMEAAKFGDCKSYFEENNLLALSAGYPVNLDQTVTNTKTFSATNAQSCSLSGNYFVHDYSGFRSRWKLNSDGFFTLNMRKKNDATFDIVWSKADTNGTLLGRIIRLHVTCTQGQSSSTRCILLKAKGTVIYSAPPERSATNTGHTSISNSPVGSHVLLLSTTSSSLSVSLTVSPSSSSSSQTSASSPPSITSVSSSLAPSSSLFPHQPASLSVSSESSTLSPSPSLELTSSTGLPQSDSSFLPFTQSQTARLPALTTGQILTTSSAELQSLLPINSDDTNKKVSTGIPRHSTNVVIMPIEPAETTMAVSSSSAADGGPGNRGAQTSGNDNGVVIGAAVGAAVVLGIVVIIFIVFWKRRKAWESTEKQTKPVKNPVYGSSENAIQLEAPKGSKTMLSIAQDNQPTYQSLINDNGKSNAAAIYSSADDEYDNCAVYQSLDKQVPGRPVYGRLNKGLPEPAHATGVPKPKPKAKTSAAGIPTSEANDVTGLPKPATTGQGTTPEPLYNVLKVTDNPAYEPTLAFDAPYAALIHRPEFVSFHGLKSKLCQVATAQNAVFFLPAMILKVR